jgi:hypothetical protein
MVKNDNHHPLSLSFLTSLIALEELTLNVALLTHYLEFKKLVVAQLRKKFSSFCETAILYKVVQIWLGRFVCKEVTVCPGHI